MNALNFFITDYQFKCYKSAFSGNIYAGVVQGFYTIFKVNNSKKKCCLTIGIYKDEADENFLSSLKDRFASAKQKATPTLDKAVLTIEYPMPAFTGYKKGFEAVKDIVYPFLMESGYKSGGFLHGKNDGTLKLYQIGCEHLYLTDGEHLEKEAELREKKEEDQNTCENVLFGTLGVLGVALAGIVLYALVGRLNLYVWAVPAALSAISAVVYKRLGKKITIKSIIIIFVILCAALAAATVLEYAWRLYDAIKNDPESVPMAFFEVLKNTPSAIMDVPELKQVVTKDILINGAVLLITSVGALIVAYKQEIRFVTIKRLD